MKYNVVLFDADDTLLDFHRAEKSALTETLIAYGLPCLPETISLYSEINASLWRMLEHGEIEKQRLRVERFERLCNIIGFSVDPNLLAVTYTDRLAEKSYILDGADKMCEKLSKICRLYIVTNGLKSVQSKRFAASGLSQYFLGSFISEDIGYEKPDVRYFDAVSSRINGFTKQNTLIVGDSLTSDIRGGAGYGIDTCWFNPSGKPEPQELKITYTVENYTELENIITNS